MIDYTIRHLATFTRPLPVIIIDAVDVAMLAGDSPFALLDNLSEGSDVIAEWKRGDVVTLGDQSKLHAEWSKP